MGSTPASNETKLGILDNEELNVHEAFGIEQVWNFLDEHSDEKLDLILVNQAHKYAFSFLYDWAGQFRRTTPLVGQLEVPEPHFITELMKNLFDDLDYKLQQVNKDDLTQVVKLIAWFEYRFIWIHPYANTNGRMGRLLSNFILMQFDYPFLSFSNRSESRVDYIAAMNKADNGDFQALENFIARELDEAIRSTL